MKTRHILLLASLLLASPSLLAQEDQGQQDQGLSQSQSQLRFEKDTVDLGDVYQENHYPVTFPFRVEGPDPLKITALETSCGCTEAHVEVEGERLALEKGVSIEAGKSGMIVATFSSQQFSHRKISTVTVRGNGLNMPSKLSISAMVHPVFELSPSRLTFGELLYIRKGSDAPVDPKELDKRTRLVFVKAPEPFTVTRWAYVPPGVSIVDTNRAETGPDGKSQTRSFEIKVHLDAAPGRITNSILGETSLGKTLEIVLVGEILGPVKYFPGERILFGMVNQGQAASRRLKAVVGGPGMTLPEPSLKLDGDAVFTAAVVDRQPGQQYEIRIDISTEATVGRHSAILRLSFPSESGIEPKEFPINAVVRQPQ
ncbi:MAG: DUF1573 domain-containing protein [Planctomycetota bacterium]|nr:MAG: DUF1573 domain-containing protein [Planctomycetota bacterium]